MSFIIQISTVPITLDAIAKELKIDKRTLLKHGIPAFRMGKKWLVSPVALIDWQARMLQFEKEHEKSKGGRNNQKNSMGQVESGEADKRKMAFDWIVQKQARSNRCRKKTRSASANKEIS